MLNTAQTKPVVLATYLFSQTGNVVVNDIQARFVFRDGKICENRDYWNGAAFKVPNT